MTDTIKCDVCRLYLNEPHPECEARTAAYHKARDVFGDGAVVGYGCLLQNGMGPVYYVGRTVKGLFEYVGIGNDWGEAFLNTRRVLLHLPREKLVLEELTSPKASVAYDKQPG